MSGGTEKSYTDQKEMNQNTVFCLFLFLERKRKKVSGVFQGEFNFLDQSSKKLS